MTPRSRSFTTLMAAVAIAFSAGLPFVALAAPKAELWERWTANDPAASATIDHAWWDGFVKAYVTAHADGVNRVAYGRVTDADRERLEDYIARLAATPIGAYGRDEQLAYWINFYNALTVEVVLDHYPVKSILDIRISPGWFSIGPWGKKLVTVEGAEISLDDIEHRILRPIWRDPRLHYALNCASVGCPNLLREAFTGATADALLTRAAREYVNNARGARVSDGRLVVSSIYEWYKSDFGDGDEGVIRHLRKYAGPELATALDGVKRPADNHYDWSLNDAKKWPGYDACSRSRLSGCK